MALPLLAGDWYPAAAHFFTGAAERVCVQPSGRPGDRTISGNRAAPGYHGGGVSGAM